MSDRDVMEVVVATRNVTKQANALAKARERLRALDKARDEQDERIEEATASVLFALEVRAEAELALESATSQVGAMKVLLVEDVSPERAAALLELNVSQVRRLVRAAPLDASRSDQPVNHRPQPAVSVDSDRADGELSARRAG